MQIFRERVKLADIPIKTEMNKKRQRKSFIPRPVKEKKKIRIIDLDQGSSKTNHSQIRETKLSNIKSFGDSFIGFMSILLDMLNRSNCFIQAFAVHFIFYQMMRPWHKDGDAFYIINLFKYYPTITGWLFILNKSRAYLENNLNRRKQLKKDNSCQTIATVSSSLSLVHSINEISFHIQQSSTGALNKDGLSSNFHHLSSSNVVGRNINLQANSFEESISDHSEESNEWGYFVDYKDQHS